MKPLHAVLAAAACALLVAGCSGPKDPTKENFAKAIVAANQPEPFCLPMYDPAEYNGTRINEFLGVPPYVQAMVDSGYMTIVEQDWSKLAKYTPEGLALYKSEIAKVKNDRGEACIGSIAFKEVLRWTEPSGGKTKVTFTVSVNGLPSWAKGPAWDKLPGVKDPIEVEADLELMNDGWRAK